MASGSAPRVTTPQQGWPATAIYPPAAYPPYGAAVAIPGHLVVQSNNMVIPFPPGRAEVLIGREDPVAGILPEIDLTSHGGDEGGISRRHARILLQGSQVMIEDLGSVNRTSVNDRPLAPHQPHPLQDGDEIRLGRVKLNYYL